MRSRLPPAMLLLWALLPAGTGAAQEKEELPQIFLEKKVYSHTAGGKRSFYETHTVEKGETLWKILERSAPLTPERYMEKLREFRRVNPGIADPSRLAVGQKIFVPAAGAEPPDDGKTVAYPVKKGDTLTGILASRGVPATQRNKYLSVVREINPSLKDVNRIFAGRNLRIPTAAYFGEAPAAAEAPKASEPVVTASAPAPSPSAGEPLPVPAPVPEGKPSAEPPAEAPLTRDVPPMRGQEALTPGKPAAELMVPKGPVPDAPVLETGRKEEGPEKREPGKDVAPPPAPSPFRGLLSDLFNALGEKWVERGTMYLPLPSGGDVVLRLEEFPIVRFSGGSEVLADFRGTLPPRVREAISASWGHIRVVSLGDAGDAGERIDRILKGSGYHSVKDGLGKPVVIGETVSVTLPARWVIQRSDQSLLAGDLVLVKEVPEKPGGELLAVLRYAQRVGIRVLPYAVDPGASEGFLVGLGEEEGGGAPLALAVPKGGGLPAVDFGLSILGIKAREGERLRIGEKGDAFQVVLQPERIFETGGKKYVVDTGRMTPGVRAILKDSGYVVFPAGKDDPGREIFRRLLKVAGVSPEERNGYLLAGGEKAGYSVRVTGAFLSLPVAGDGRTRAAVLVRGKVHSATRALVRDLGVEIMEW